jgi:nitroimidazol reductase NimA-like FMN-containing flavoprotein (pyridoxamine 5'-phosphate oxidase superfamily)/GNAT superfamily N-acetyltransferase
MKTPVLTPTTRTRIRRHPERAVPDRAALNALLDAGWLIHVSFLDEAAQPFVIPTSYVRMGDALYLHGAVASRLLRTGGAGAELCATVTLLDGLVLARSAFHHSMNYRSAVIFGRGRALEDEAHKRRVMAAFVDRLIPGRAEVVRPPDARELAQTTILELPLDEASVKVRTGPPIDREDDLELPVWAGVIPLAIGGGRPLPQPGVVGSPPARTLAGPIPPEDTPPVEGRHGAWVLSDDRARIDFARVASWLADAYWCRGIPRALVEEAARHSSLVVAAYDEAGQQIGYLRVVSDCTRFANVMDVYVAEPQRRHGLGRAMVRFALAHPRHRAIPRWLLGTQDAHGVYAHEGFRPLSEPERLMQRVTTPPWPEPTSEEHENA